MARLTKRTVDAVKPSDRDIVLWDEEVLGFGLRVKPSGVRSYLVQYRNAHGRSRRLTLGRHGVLTPDQARKAAQQLLAAVGRGTDPATDRQTLREAPMVGELLDRYIVEHVERHNRPSTAVEVKRLIDRHVRPALGTLKAGSVTRQDVANMHRAMDATPRQANFALAVCSKAFNLAEAWGMRPEGSNPCTKIARYPERARERFLSDDELARLGTALRLAETEGLPWPSKSERISKHERKPENRRNLYPWQVPAAIRLLLLTGCRLSEILKLGWDQVDLQARTATLLETKSGGGHTVALNAVAVQLLAKLPKIKSSPWVLPMITDAKRPFSKDTLEGAWQRIRAAAGLEDARIHDLRHTVGTYAGQSGANAFLVRDLLHHKSLAVTGRYVSRDVDPVRELSDQVGGRIAAGLEGKAKAEVVPLASAEGRR